MQMLLMEQLGQQNRELRRVGEEAAIATKECASVKAQLADVERVAREKQASLDDWIWRCEEDPYSQSPCRLRQRSLGPRSRGCKPRLRECRMVSGGILLRRLRRLLILSISSASKPKNTKRKFKRSKQE